MPIVWKNLFRTLTTYVYPHLLFIFIRNKREKKRGVSCRLEIDDGDRINSRKKKHRTLSFQT